MLTVTERRWRRRSALLAFASVPTAKANLPAGAGARVSRPIRTSLVLLPPASERRSAHSATSRREPASFTSTLPRTRVPFWDFGSVTASFDGAVGCSPPPDGGGG